jgi:hypothetical protein
MIMFSALQRFYAEDIMTTQVKYTEAGPRVRVPGGEPATAGRPVFAATSVGRDAIARSGRAEVRR